MLGVAALPTHVMNLHYSFIISPFISPSLFKPFFCKPHSHVQVNNEDALAFYRKFDFHSVETKEQYYKRIDPPHAHVLQKDMRASQAAADPPAPPEPNVTDTEYID